MRLGGPIFTAVIGSEDWVRAVQAQGYRAAYCPVGTDADEDMVRAYAAAAERADIVIAEVGAWSNPISPDTETRRRAIRHCQARLALADRIGARCCVNIAGSRSALWDGPDAGNLTEDTFALIVETTREIIDAVRPTRTVYALETMPWVLPDSPESYLRLIQAIDRPGFGVHLDVANMINSPRRYYENAAFIRECFALLGPHIRSCHAKDITMQPKLTVHLDEVRPGLGTLDYRVFLQEASRLAPDTPVMLEHLPTAEEYDQAAQHLRTVAEEIGVPL